MKKAGGFVLAIIALILPVMLAVNIIRTEANGKDDQISFYELMANLSEINVSFSATYLQIAEAGVAWQDVVGQLRITTGTITTPDGQIGQIEVPGQVGSPVVNWLLDNVVAPVANFFKDLFTTGPSGDFTLEAWFNGLIEGIGNFFNALWQSICIPFVFIGEACQMIYDVIKVFATFVGFVPGTE